MDKQEKRKKLQLKNTGKKVPLIVNDDGCRGTMGKRTLWKGDDGNEYVKFNGGIWKYPNEVDY